MGRPSSYSEEIANEICHRLAHGEPLAKIVRDDHMPDYSTVWRWEESNEAFRKLSLRARIEGTHYLADDSLRIADDPEIDAQRAKLMIDTRLRLIGKWNRKAYGEHQTIEHEGLEGRSDEEIKARIAALEAKRRAGEG